MAFVIKAEIADTRAKRLAFTAQKTMYDGKRIAEGDTIFVFTSENEGGQGLIARGVVTHAQPVAKKPGIVRQTPRVSIAVRVIAAAKRPLGRQELKRYDDWNDGQPQTELNFKFYRQATNKIAGITDETAAYLARFFSSARRGRPGLVTAARVIHAGDSRKSVIESRLGVSPFNCRTAPALPR